MAEADKYEVMEKIGHGSFGVIRKVRRKTDGMVLCRKEISYLKMSQKEREQLHAEFQILSTLRHPNIVGYYHREHLKQSQDLHLYMEYCGNGDLGRVIRDLAHKNQYAEESFVWSIFSQLVTALFRCHYGVDPPEVGKHTFGLGPTARPKAPTGGMTILHRDLKPENVFLGEDNSVKLGDFGLSKMIQSHDFASTYVGTPFYMSPEICAAEKYTLKSDIWSLGCIIYELCTREPPFNAKSHFQLVQKIKEGRIAPLPSCYSPELLSTIKDCLKVNPDRRPDTAALLNLPIVRLMRKEKEVVELSRMLKTKEDMLNRRIRELEQKISMADADKDYMRQEIDSSLRREWEVKARLEIDRLVGQEVEGLQKKFELEVQARVEAEMQKKTVTFSAEEPEEFSSSLSKSDYPHSSIGAVSADYDFPSTTDITELSVDSPDTSASSLKPTTRTPFGRAQTMFAGTPMDIEMASPSPIAIASLSLSPRRNAATKAPHTNNGNIFQRAKTSGGDPRWDTAREPALMESDEEEEEDEPPLPSPTRMIKSSKNPFTCKQRPALIAQKTAPINGLKSKQPSFAVPTKSNLAKLSNPDAAQFGPKEPTKEALRERCPSPNRRLSKIPSAANLAPGASSEPVPQAQGQGQAQTQGGGGGLSRKPSTNKKDNELGKIAAKNNIKGRTLVELQQARAGGRPLSAIGGENNNMSPKRAYNGGGAKAASSGGKEAPAVWDPDTDEMPSPFLVRRKAVARV